MKGVIHYENTRGKRENENLSKTIPSAISENSKGQRKIGRGKIEGG